MKIYSLLSTSYIHNKEFIMDSVVLCLENGVKIVCSDFQKSSKAKLFVTVWNPQTKKWGTALMRNKYSQIMCDFYRSKHKRRKASPNWAKMMEHDRKRKSGTGGVRLGKWCGQITDYECTKNPLHDFRRVYN